MTKTKERQKNTREKSSTTSSFSANIFQKESNMEEEQAPPLEEHLEIMSCTKGKGIFLVLQYLLPPGPWR